MRPISPDDPAIGDNKSAVFHCLCRILSEESAESRSNLFQEASAAYDLISQASWSDELGQREEMLCRCAFLAWRSARLHEEADAQIWLSRFQAALGKRSPLRFKVERYLATPAEGRSEEFQKNHLSDPEVLLSICGMLRDQKDVSPATVAKEASAIYRWLARYDRGKSIRERFGLILSGEKRDPSRSRDYFFGDELEYFLGEAAFLAGTCFRHLGQRAEALSWLDRAEAGFQHTANSAAGLANVAYARLALRFEMGRYEDVLDLLPSLLRRYEELSMRREMAKCRLLEAMALKCLSRVSEALEMLEPVCNSGTVKEDRLLYGRFLVELGDLHQLDGRFDTAMIAYRKALPLLQGVGLSVALADLKLVIGTALRGQPRPAQAIEALRAARDDYRGLGMATRQAYVHLLIAEAFLAMNHDREAEKEILAALPTIEEQKMVPEGFAAVALLRESVRRQKADPEALRQLREHLQAKG